MSKFHSAASLSAQYSQRFAQPGTVDLQAGAEFRNDPDFGGEKVESIHAASILSFNTAGKLKTVKALSHFMVAGETVLKGDLLELPEEDFKRMGPSGTGQVAEATGDEIAAAQKGSKGK